MSTNDTSKPSVRFIRIVFLQAGDTPWRYSSNPGWHEGPYEGGSVEEILDAEATAAGSPEWASDNVQWWERGDELWIAPLDDDDED